jgi:hypothetical protein
VKKSFLYLVREGAQELYDQRFHELEFDYRKQSRRFQLWGPWMEHMPPKILETGNPYREWAKEFAPCSMAIDGLRRFFDGDENSSEVMDPVGQELRVGQQWSDCLCSPPLRKEQKYRQQRVLGH